MPENMTVIYRKPELSACATMGSGLIFFTKRTDTILFFKQLFILFNCYSVFTFKLITSTVFFGALLIIHIPFTCSISLADFALTLANWFMLLGTIACQRKLRNRLRFTASSACLLFHGQSLACPFLPLLTFLSHFANRIQMVCETVGPVLRPLELLCSAGRE